MELMFSCLPGPGRKRWQQQASIKVMQRSSNRLSRERDLAGYQICTVL
jgi:hypothetical protein